MTTTASWSPLVASAALFVSQLTPADLPPTPWALKESCSKEIGGGIFLGGPYATVIDNTQFLFALQRDIERGPSGPRAQTGALQDDLFALKTTVWLKRRKEGRSAS